MKVKKCLFNLDSEELYLKDLQRKANQSLAFLSREDSSDLLLNQLFTITNIEDSMQIYIFFKTKQILNTGELIETSFTHHLGKEL
jgi:hypothetical protein